MFFSKRFCSFLTAVTLTAVMLTATGFAAALGSELLGADFNNGIPSSFKTESTGGGSVTSEGGAAKILCSNAGGSGVKTARLTTPMTSLPDRGIIYFSLTPSISSSTKAVGVTKGEESTNFITISSAALSIGGAKVMDVSEKMYRFALSFNSGEVNVYADGNKIYSGTNSIFSGGIQLYFSALARTANEVSSLIVDDLYIWSGGNFAPVFESGAVVVPDIGRLRVRFGTPLLKVPAVELRSEGDAVDTTVSFVGDVLTIVPQNLEEGEKYTLKITEIYDYTGAKTEDVQFSFETTPVGYKAPVVTTEISPAAARVGKAVTVLANVQSDREIERLELWVDDVLTQAKPSGTLQFTPSKGGNYTVFVRAYDDIAYGNSTPVVINAAENTPPVITVPDLPADGRVEYQTPQEVAFGVTDDTLVSSVSVLINGSSENHSLVKNGDYYVIKTHKAVLGEVNIKISAVDEEGAKSEKSINLVVQGAANIPTVTTITEIDQTTLAAEFSGPIPVGVPYKAYLVFDGTKTEVEKAEIIGSIMKITPKTPLLTAGKYVLTVEWERDFAADAGAINTKSFETKPADFDIVNFAFINEGTKTGASAKVYNFRSWESKRAVMVMTLVDDRGAVREIYSSTPVTAYSATGAVTLFDIGIAPVETKGYRVRVFFLNGWEDYLGIKNRIYEN